MKLQPALELALERGKRLALSLPTSLAQKVPSDHREADQAFARRRRVVAGVSLTGAGLLGVSLSTRRGSPQFYAATLGVAGVWVVGGIAAGPLHLGWVRGPDRTLRRPVVTPIATGGYAFAVFYGAALLARHVPVLDESVGEKSSDTLVTRNPALVLAGAMMGTLFALRRRATGGIQAPLLTHLTWATLMLRYLPPLFPAADQIGARVDRPGRRCSSAHRPRP